MARVLCAYSGLEFKVEFFPAYFGARECYHPIFTLSRQKLIKNISRWADNSLCAEENYLLYLGLLNSTGLIEWRVPAIRTAETARIIAANMEALARIVGKIDISINNPDLSLPQYVINTETKDLSSTADWIKIWEENYKDFQNNYKSATHREKVSRREATLERLIKDKNKSAEHYAGMLSEWAALVADFPTWDAGLDKSILSGRQMPLADYWKIIIRRCAKSESIFEIPDADIDELIEHCETNIDIASSGIYGHTLLVLLREGKRRKSSFLGLGDFDVSGPSFRILDADTSVEDANKLAMIDTAPTTEPVAKDYPSKIAYLRAKLKYDMAVEYKKNNPEDRSGTVPVLNRRITDI